MFSQTFVHGPEHSQKALTFTLSTAFQIAAVVLAVLLPLLYRQTLPEAQLKSILAAPRLAVPHSPATVRPASHASSVTRRTFQISRTEFSRVPKTVSAPDVSPVPQIADTPGLANDQDFVTLLSGSTTQTPQERPVPPVIAKSKLPGIVRIGGQVAEANLLRKVAPQYPQLARVARVQGQVEFSAIMSKTGQVERLQLLRGHPLLVSAAREAILQWRYRPTLLNGQAVDVSTNIVIDFKLAQ
jgi:periplasmic protein TonB